MLHCPSKVFGTCFSGHCQLQSRQWWFWFFEPSNRQEMKHSWNLRMGRRSGGQELWASLTRLRSFVMGALFVLGSESNGSNLNSDLGLTEKSDFGMAVSCTPVICGFQQLPWAEIEMSLSKVFEIKMWGYRMIKPKSAKVLRVSEWQASTNLAWLL